LKVQAQRPAQLQLILTNYLLTNKLSELITVEIGEPKLTDGSRRGITN